MTSTPGFILTASEAAAVLRCEVTDADMLALLPQVNAYIQTATGRDWSADETIVPQAKTAARMLLVKWHEDPGMNGSQAATLTWGLSGVLVQLEAIALAYHSFQGRDGAGACSLAGADVGDQVLALVGIIGVDGDQSSGFEAAITVQDQIQQLSTSDLSVDWFRVQLISPEEM